MSLDSAVPQQTTFRAKPGAREIFTVGLLLGAALLLALPFGFLWAVIAWASGAGLLWSSTRWNARDKALGTLVWPGGLIGPALLSTSVGQVCTQVMEGGSGLANPVLGEPVCTGWALSPWLGLPLFVVVIGAPFVVAAALLNRDNPT